MEVGRFTAAEIAACTHSVGGQAASRSDLGGCGDEINMCICRVWNPNSLIFQPAAQLGFPLCLTTVLVCRCRNNARQILTADLPVELLEMSEQPRSRVGGLRTLCMAVPAFRKQHYITADINKNLFCRFLTNFTVFLTQL